MKGKTRPIPKGRAVDAKALADVQALLGDAPRRRDLLIEHLHKLNDHHGHLPAAQLAALAQEMRMALTEVYEVATFYHHFEVVKEGEPAPPPLTVRVCDSISCELAGAQQLLKLNLGPGVRVIPAPCVGRCEVAPCVHVGENPVGNATADKLRAAVDKKQHDCPIEPYIGYQEYRKDGGYKLIRDCLAGKLRIASSRACWWPPGAPVSARSGSICAMNTPAAARSWKKSSRCLKPMHPALCRRFT